MSVSLIELWTWEQRPYLFFFFFKWWANRTPLGASLVLCFVIWKDEDTEKEEVQLIPALPHSPFSSLPIPTPHSEHLALCEGNSHLPAEPCPLQLLGWMKTSRHCRPVSLCIQSTSAFLVITSPSPGFRRVPLLWALTAHSTPSFQHFDTSLIFIYLLSQ